MNEIMSGEHEFEASFGEPGKRPMEFRARWGTDNLGQWVDPFGEGFLVSDLNGVVTIDGLCEGAPCTGSLELRYFKDQTIRYTFEFEVDGVPYRYVGEKVCIKPWNLVWSHTTCFGRLVNRETGELISTSVIHFRFRRIFGFLASARLSLA